MIGTVRTNERSWAIDVISEINRLVATTSRSIKRAGGESTLTAQSTRLFPDVLLYGGDHNTNVLQGWELKMPDTPVTDPELIRNAKTKANLLRTNSFVLWNVCAAVLYIRGNDGEFHIYKTWDELRHIQSRDEVDGSAWRQMLQHMLIDLNGYLETNAIQSVSIIDALTEEGIIDFVLNLSPVVADHLRGVSTRDGDFDAYVSLWWLSAKHEYRDVDDKWYALARLILVNWLNKFIFAHILKTYHNAAGRVAQISDTTTVVEAEGIFSSISATCDFWNIFKPLLGERYLPKAVWHALVQINHLLLEFRFEQVSPTLLHQLLQKTVYASKRRVAGQFSTPPTLAALLVRLTMKDKTGTMFDPCCGTGTIARAAYQLKKAYQMPAKEALATVWASDKFAYPLQMATLALVDPDNIGQVMRIFRSDVTGLQAGQPVSLHDPYDGHEVVEQLPTFDSIATNLPFVQQEDFAKLNPDVDSINEEIGRLTGSTLDKLAPRSDLYAYLVFYLWKLVVDGGRIGLIVSNAWLGTAWGTQFQKVVRKFFDVELVMTSGKGKWFDNAAVVTNIVILRKRPDVTSKSDQPISFVTLNKSLAELNTDEVLDGAVAHALVGEGATSGSFVSKQVYSPQEIDEFEAMGALWSGLFADIKWMHAIEDRLIKVNKLFTIKRGEKSGWDPMFYPMENHGIEADYIKPVLKSSKSIDTLLAKADAKAFCCLADMDELQRKNHTGALAWIHKFERGVNKTGEPLIPVLKKLKGPNLHWYSMNNAAMADLVANVNYDKRLFIARLRERSFVNQRLIRFTKRDEAVDVDVCHALINSLIGLFYIEFLGFGRGQGALDLSAAKFQHQMMMLNPARLDETQKQKILLAFAPLLERSILPILEELEMADRNTFDDVVLEAFGLTAHKASIRDALQTLYRIRMSVKVAE
ncbi:N-6 DNA methylase [Alicyclobacillus fodiniaquatilis]|uniref:N-6 DNA methylase n=1 Tax=Alicyclobacillus fodiniaquatilis TaxID=1661150 RepID=A0ABW4JID4_9BACL